MEKMHFSSFVFHQVVQKHYWGEVEKQTNFWLADLSLMFLPKIMKIGNAWSS